MEKQTNISAQRTQGEWGFSKYSNDIAIVCDEKPADIALVRTSGGKQGISEEEAEANAKFICHAVNNHEVLANALKEAMDIIDRLGEEYHDLSDRHSSYTNGEYKRLSAALNKALNQ